MTANASPRICDTHVTPAQSAGVCCLRHVEERETSSADRYWILPPCGRQNDVRDMTSAFAIHCCHPGSFYCHPGFIPGPVFYTEQPMSAQWPA